MKRGFTTVELLVVVAVIAILAGLLVYGASKMINSNKSASAGITVNAARSMYDELAAKGQGTVTKSPQVWLWTDTTNNLMTPAGDVDFFKIPYRDPLNPVRNPDALDAPGAFGDELNKYSSAVLNTQTATIKLLAMPTNRAAMDKMQNTWLPEWKSGEYVSLWSDGTLHKTPIIYAIGQRVTYNGSQYMCIANHIAMSPPAGDTTNWQQEASPPPMLLLDDWQHPIIFVPGTGLRTRVLADKKEIDGSPQQLQIITNGGQVLRTSGTQIPYVTVPGQPFFASAGPDGDFSKGDDNIYSFTK